MTQPKALRSLSRLLDLREREVDRLMSDIASKQTVRKRYQGNLDRLEHLYDSIGASGAVSPVMSLNCADYKQSVMALADTHRTDFLLHEADMEVAQRTLNAATQRREVLGQVLAQQQSSIYRAQLRFDQKQQDELASQVWWRGQQ